MGRGWGGTCSSLVGSEIKSPPTVPSKEVSAGLNGLGRLWHKGNQSFCDPSLVQGCYVRERRLSRKQARIRTQARMERQGGEEKKEVTRKSKSNEEQPQSPWVRHHSRY